jgi:hypothetical protein
MADIDDTNPTKKKTPTALEVVTAERDAALAELARRDREALREKELHAAPQARPATPAASLPPAARAALKEGQNVTFGNGQTWTLRNGQPVRLR